MSKTDHVARWGEAARADGRSLAPEIQGELKLKCTKQGPKDRNSNVRRSALLERELTEEEDRNLQQISKSGTRRNLGGFGEGFSGVGVDRGGALWQLGMGMRDTFLFTPSSLFRQHVRTDKRNIEANLDELPFDPKFVTRALAEGEVGNRGGEEGEGEGKDLTANFRSL